MNPSFHCFFGGIDEKRFSENFGFKVKATIGMLRPKDQSDPQSTKGGRGQKYPLPELELKLRCCDAQKERRQKCLRVFTRLLNW